MRESTMEIEIVYKITKKGYTGWIKNYPSIISEGESLYALRINLKDALNTMLSYLFENKP